VGLIHSRLPAGATVCGRRRAPAEHRLTPPNRNSPRSPIHTQTSHSASGVIPTRGEPPAHHPCWSRRYGPQHRGPYSRPDRASAGEPGAPPRTRAAAAAGTQRAHKGHTSGHTEGTPEGGHTGCLTEECRFAGRILSGFGRCAFGKQRAHNSMCGHTRGQDSRWPVTPVPSL
jgi:hypothetical protein